MDTITHGITGALIAKACFTEREGRVATLAVTVGAVFPDIDTLTQWFHRDRIAFLEIHRGLTHSLVMLPVFAVLLGAVTAVLAHRKEKWLFFSMLYGIGIGSHIFLDVLTAYGTMVWSPISHARISWDTTFIVDVVFTTIVLLPQLVAWVYSDRALALRRGVKVGIFFALAAGVVAPVVSMMGVYVSERTAAIYIGLVAAALCLPLAVRRGFRWRPAVYCRAGVAALAIYMVLCAVAHHVALTRVEKFAQSSGLSVKQTAALPLPPSLWHWSGLVQTENGTYRASMDLGHLKQPVYAFFSNATDYPYIAKAESLPDTKIFLWFARFPWVERHWNNGVLVVDIEDLQFLGPMLRDYKPPFTFQVTLDRQGNVLRSGMLKR